MKIKKLSNFIIDVVILILMFFHLGCNNVNKNIPTNNTLENNKLIVEKKPEKSFASIKLNNLYINQLEDSVLYNPEGPLLITFSLMNCSPCIREYKELSTVINKWESQYKVKSVIIFINTKSKMEKRFNLNAIDREKLTQFRHQKFLKFQKKYSLNLHFYEDIDDELTNFLYNYEGIDTNFIDSKYYRGNSRISIPQNIIIDTTGLIILQKLGYKNLNEIENKLKEITSKEK